MTAASQRAQPISLTAHYLAPGQPGPVETRTEIVKAGRTFTTVAASLHSEDRRLLHLLGTFGEPIDQPEPRHVIGAPPTLPDPDACAPMMAPPEGSDAPALRHRIDVRLHPDDAPRLDGPRSGDAVIRGYFRLHDDEPMDTFAVLLAADAFPPTVFNLDLAPGWVPTVELTAHLRAVPVPGWLRCRFATRFMANGLLEEDAEIWDESGQLVAQARQLALIPRAW